MQEDSLIGRSMQNLNATSFLFSWADFQGFEVFTLYFLAHARETTSPWLLLLLLTMPASWAKDAW